MKRIGNLWPSVMERGNLARAFHQAALGKRRKIEVRRFARDLDSNLDLLRRELEDRTFETGRFNVFKVYDPKERTIHAARFPERVFHHALMNLCEPVLERQAVFHSYACRKGKGRLAAIHAAEQAARGASWYVKLDIRKYFESIPQELLIGRLQRLFKDREILYWLEKLLRGHRTAGQCVPLDQSDNGDEEWRRAGCPRHGGPGILPGAFLSQALCQTNPLAADAGRGLPIGSLTSQHLANFYLGPLDRFCQGHPAVSAYCRYMDDFVCWGHDKSAMTALGREIQQFVEGSLDLVLKYPPCPQPTLRGMDFLGYRIFPSHTALNRRSKVRYWRRLRALETRHQSGDITETGLQQRLTALTAFVLPVRSHEFRLGVMERFRSAAIGHEPGEPGRQLEQQREQLPRRQPQQQQPDQQQQQHRVPHSSQLRPTVPDGTLMSMGLNRPPSALRAIFNFELWIMNFELKTKQPSPSPREVLFSALRFDVGCSALDVRLFRWPSAQLSALRFDVGSSALDVRCSPFRNESPLHRAKPSAIQNPKFKIQNLPRLPDFPTMNKTLLLMLAAWILAAAPSAQAVPGSAMIYNVTVNTRSAVSTLFGLTLSSGTLSPAFTAATKIYTASVTNATTSMTVTPTVTDTTATIKVNGTAVASGVASGAISLVVGSNPITVLVTAQDGTTQSTYTVTVTRAPSAVSTLSGLVLSSGTLSPTFAAGGISYTASVPNATTSMTVTPTVTDTTATIKVNGTAVTSGVASGAISLVVGSNPITVLVTAQDGTTQSTYTVTVTRPPSAVSTLSALVLSSGILSPSFVSETLGYTTSVTNATTSMTVTPTVTDATATIKVNGTAVASGIASGAISLVVGNNPITVLVTAQDGTTQSTYTITVTRAPSAVATLALLTLSSGTLSPTFATGIKVYTSSVANATTGLTVTPTVTDSTAMVTVNGESVASGTVSAVIPLVVGSNTISVLVTAQDGTTTATYTVTVTRISTLSTLSGLALSAGTLSPAFSAETLAYTARVANATSSITVTPTVTDATATVRVNGTTVVSGAASGAITLSVGNNPIAVLVTAQDGTTTSTYTVTVNRISTVSTLSSLVLSSGTLSPAFAATTKTYTASVANGTSSITVTPTVTDATATITVNGVGVTSGTASASISLVVGTNPITVVGTAQDGTTTSTYTITVTRISTVSTLSGLVLSTGTLSPVFATGAMAYTASVPNATSSITVTPTVTDATATVKVNGTTVVSGAASGAITLSVGNNPIAVLVTAQDGTTTSTYTVTVNRISTISTLSSLVLSSGTLSPAFAAATKTYTASVPNATASITVTPTLTNLFAAVTVNGTPVTSGTASASIQLTVGSNPITVLVTAQDGTTTSTYTITITRFATDSSLSGLALSTGTLSPAFATGTAAYTTSVPNATAGLTVTPTVTHSAATVKVNGVSVASGVASASVPLAVGSNAINVQVTAQDPAFTTSYTVTVTRPALVAPSFTSATTVPCSLANITTPANVVNLSLAYAPSAGTNLMVVRNTGLSFITGRFANLAQGQVVTLPYNNDTYRFVVNYFGGTGNDLVLQWADNKAYTWGSNSLGQLGNTDSPSSSVPLAVMTSDVLADKTFVSIAVGSSHSVALCSDGTVAAWGNNTYGQLGDGTNNNSNVPVAVVMSGALSSKTVVAVAAGFNHSLALCSDGTVAAWGFNSSGQLGNSNNTSSNVPVAVTKTGALLNKTVVAVAAGYNHSLARCSDGTVITWGGNAYGQLGNNTINNSNVPVNITTSGELNGRTVLFLVGGSDHSIGLCSDGSLVSWGRNNYGQLGNGDLINSGLPLVVDASDVLAGKVITAIATGGWHTLALCSDGTLAAFGRNNNGQLGNGGTTDSSVPVRVVTATGTLFNKTITAIGGSNAHSLALCADGTLAAWGSNNNGQLGNDIAITSSNVPIAVTRSTLGSGEKFTDLATGSSANHVMALAAFHVSSNSTLAGLALSSGSLSPTFAGGTTVYAASVTNATTSVTVTPSVTEANATVKVNGALVTTGTASASIPLVVGNSPITVQVTAQDGITTSTYTVTVTRVSTVSTLSGLALSAGSLSPAFATGTTTYTTTVTTGMMSVTPTVTDSNATVTVNGVSVATGAASASIPLVLGTNPINVQVTAQDGTTKSTYTVNVTRLSTVSTLAGLAISPGTLSPAFATGTTGYMAIMPATATGVSVTPSVTDPTATIKVDGATVASGASSATIPITDTQAIATVVTAQDGSTTTYTLTVAICGFEAWQTRVFIDPADLNNPAVSGELEMPAHDGITNLMKYALALDPMICGTAGLPTVAQQDGYLTLTYRKNKTATDVTYTVQVAADLTGNAWTLATTVVSQTDQGDHWRVTVRDSVPYAGQARRFMRLQVGK